MFRNLALCASALGLTIASGLNASGPDSPSAKQERDVAASQTPSADPFWRNATIYFLMTDRFANGDPANDRAYGRKPDGDTLRSFMGGDIAGIIAKLEEGYFRDLGVDAIWTTPVIEQVRQPFEEFGRSYAFHGYWARDWTKVDEAYGTEAEFARMVELAHGQGIRVVVDVVINHAGPPFASGDPRWPSDWVRSGPDCDWKTFAGVATCQIVPALQDVVTEKQDAVDLPPHLVAKWRKEGRLKQELAELDAFFERTGYPRAPQYYLIKWNTDWVREYGVDAFRIDTAKHVDPEVWAALKKEAQLAFSEWKAANPKKAFDDRKFYMFGEVFNFGANGFQHAVAGTRDYDYGDRHVDFFEHGFDGLINMGFATHARLPVADLFQLYANEMDGPFKGVALVNYISSHDDQSPLDPTRLNAYDNAIKLLLAPGSAQIYYGDETNRSLVVEGATGDATLRSFMNWDALNSYEGRAVLTHWQKLATFRKRHLSIGAGSHVELSWSPYVFSRALGDDKVLVSLPDQPIAAIKAHGVFPDGTRVRDAYSGDVSVVAEGQIAFETPRKIFLIEAAGGG